MGLPLAHAETPGGRWLDRKNEGWFWYAAEPGPSVVEPPEPEPVAAAPMPAVQPGSCLLPGLGCIGKPIWMPPSIIPLLKMTPLI